MNKQNCPNCGKKVGCGVEAGNKTCWCLDYPAIMSMDKTSSSQSCLCSDCLSKAIQQKISANLDSLPLSEALQVAAKYKSEGSLLENIDYTIENGNYVFSSWYHLKRGTCCGNGCRNCPY